MPKNSFGTPILASSYRDRKDRARVADEKKYDGRDKEAKKYLEEKKKQHGTTRVYTLCMIYNATGERVFIYTQKDWHGHVYNSFPTIIQNGQWGALLHVQTDNGPGSEAALLYRGKLDDGQEADTMVAWDNRRNNYNHVYTEIHTIDVGTDWEQIRKKLEDRSAVHTASLKGIQSTLSIDQDPSNTLEAIFTYK